MIGFIMKETVLLESTSDVLPIKTKKNLSLNLQSHGRKFLVLGLCTFILTFAVGILLVAKTLSRKEFQIQRISSAIDQIETQEITVPKPAVPVRNPKPQVRVPEKWKSSKKTSYKSPPVRAILKQERVSIPLNVLNSETFQRCESAIKSDVFSIDGSFETRCAVFFRNSFRKKSNLLFEKRAERLMYTFSNHFNQRAYSEEDEGLRSHWTAMALALIPKVKPLRGTVWEGLSQTMKNL